MFLETRDETKKMVQGLREREREREISTKKMIEQSTCESFSKFSEETTFNDHDQMQTKMVTHAHSYGGTGPLPAKAQNLRRSQSNRRQT